MAVVVPFLIQAVVSVAASYVIGKLFGPKPQNTEGPKLEDRRVQSSTYGASIPYVFGTYRLPGTVIWGTDLEEEAVTSSGGGGGKGGPSSGTNTEYNYYGNFAIQLCEGPITGIRRVWADGRLIFSSAYSVGSFPFARIYLGDEAQLPDPFMQTKLGLGKTPAHRGTAYVVFERYALKDYGNRIPNFTFEVERSLVPSAGTLGAPSNPFPGTTSLSLNLISYVQAVSPTIGAAVYVAGAAGLAVAAAETANATGEYGFEVAVFNGSAWVNGSTFRYSNRGGGNASAAIWPGQSRGRRLVFEQVVLGATVVNSVFIGSAGTSAARQAAESFTLPAAYVGASQLTNFSYGARVAADRLKVIVDPIAHKTYLIAATHAANKGGIFSGTALAYAYDFRPLALAGHSLLDACFDGAQWRTIERAPSGLCSLKVFNSAFNLVSSSPLPSGTSDWRISRRGALTYALAVPSGELFLELSGRWCALGSTGLVSPTETAHAQGRNYTWDIVRPTAGQWVLWRHALLPGAGFTSLPGLGGGYTLAGIVSALCVRTGIDPANIDTSQLLNNVRGYMVPRPMTARAAIEAVCHAHFIEGVESDGKIKFYPLNQPIQYDIPEEDLDARAYGTAPKQLMALVRAQEVELPKRVTLVYASFNGPNYDYQEAETHAQRLATSAVQEERQDVPISFKLAEALPIAECHLRRAWLQRTTAEFTTQTGTANHAYTLLEPGDIVTCRGYTLRIVDKLEAKGIIQWKAVVDDPGIYPFITSTGGIGIELTDPPDEINEPDDGADDTGGDDVSDDNGDSDADSDTEGEGDTGTDDGNDDGTDDGAGGGGDL